MALLTHYRALDLTDEKGLLCGKILGDLGVDVIKVEKPGGDSSRNIGPFYHNIPDPEKSLFWFAYNTNKRGITLNIDTADGREIFKKLVSKADFIIESFPPDYMDKIGLSYSSLSEINPRIIMTSITPFGQSGPFKDYKGSDVVLWAMGGMMYSTGDPDRPPVWISIPQAYLHAGAHAAAGTLIAHYHREVTGEGQRVDVSIQECVASAPLTVQQYWDLNRLVVPRSGPCRPIPTTGTRHQVNWPCKDGYISSLLFGGRGGAARLTRVLAKWAEEEGMATEEFKKLNWEGLDIGAMTPQEAKILAEPIKSLFMGHTKEELYNEASQRRASVYPVSTAKEVLQNRQLAAREFWAEIEHTELDATITYPGVFVKSKEIPQQMRPPPLIGEHNEEIYRGEFGIPPEEIILLKQSGVI